MADRARIRAFLEEANFRPMLYEMGWNRLRLDPFLLAVGGRTFEFEPIAERCGFQIFEVQADDGYIPHTQWRWDISTRIERRAAEHLLVFVGVRRSQFLWQSPPRASLRHGVASHRALTYALGSGIVDLIAGLDLRPLGDDPSIADVTARAARAFRDDRRDYYRDYYRRLAAAETEAGVDSQTVRKSTWNYVDNVASSDLNAADFRNLESALGESATNAIRPPLRLDTEYSPVHRDRRALRGNVVRADLLHDADAESPDDAAEQQLLREQIEDVLASLTSRERRVLQLRFGLEDGRLRTLEEVGREFGVTRERIRQIEAKALRKLRHPSRSKKLRAYLDGGADIPALQTSVPPLLWERLYPPDAGMVFVKVLLRLSDLAESSGPDDSDAFTEYCEALRDRRDELQRQRSLARSQGAMTTLYLRCGTGAIKLTDVPLEVADAVLLPLRKRLSKGKPRTLTSPVGHPQPSNAPVCNVPGGACTEGTTLTPDCFVRTGSADDDFVIDDRPPQHQQYQQPLDLPGSLPLFDQPPPRAQEPTQPEPHPATQLLFTGFRPEPPPATNHGLSPDEMLEASVQAFRHEGYAVADNRAKGGPLWVYDPRMALANRIESLRSIGITFIYAEHKTAGKWGWWAK